MAVWSAGFTVTGSTSLPVTVSLWEDMACPGLIPRSKAIRFSSRVGSSIDSANPGGLVPPEPRSMPKHSEATRIRIQDGLKKYGRIVAQARLRGMNQQDTGDIVKAMLGDMLGFDPFFDVTTEASVRGPNADHAIVLGGEIKLLLIVKGIGIVPHAAHLL